MDNGIEIKAGDFFWVYGLHGFGGDDIERYFRIRHDLHITR